MDKTKKKKMQTPDKISNYCNIVIMLITFNGIWKENKNRRLTDKTFLIREKKNRQRMKKQKNISKMMKEMNYFRRSHFMCIPRLYAYYIWDTTYAFNAQIKWNKRFYLRNVGNDFMVWSHIIYEKRATCAMKA